MPAAFIEAVLVPDPGTLVLMRPVELGVVPVALGVVTDVFVAGVFVVALLGAVPAEVVPATFVPGAPVADLLAFPAPGVAVPTLDDVELGTHGRVCVLLLIPVGVVVVPPIGVVLGMVVLVPDVVLEVPGVVVLPGNVVLFGVVDGLTGVVTGL